MPLEDVVDRDPRPAAFAREVVAPVGCRHEVLGDLRPADPRGRVELGELELAPGLHAGILDRARVHGPDPRRPIRRLGDLKNPRAELRIVLTIREKREDLIDRTVDHDRRLEPTRHAASFGGLSVGLRRRRIISGRPAERPIRGLGRAQTATASSRRGSGLRPQRARSA